MLHHLTGGRWGLPIRRILEAGSRTIPADGRSVYSRAAGHEDEQDLSVDDAAILVQRDHRSFHVKHCI